MTTAPLSQGTGYGIVVGLGIAFAIVMIGLTYSLRRYQKEIVTSEEFNTAGRSVNKGLIASAVVSSWTWAATLLQSTSQAYKNGVSGPFWYASGATVQIILFATLAIELKKKAPGAHTYLEVIKVRYGPIGHGVYLFFAVCTNILVTVMLLTGGSAVISDLTGMNTVAACFLIPLSVSIFTLAGGLKSTFLSDYIHTVILIVIIMIFAFTTYATSDALGSPGAVWDALVKRAIETPIEGNAGGSYLTMRSHSGAIFFVINIIGNFGTVFLDNGYWNKAIAASPAAAFPGYVLGGIAWFAIPWLTATTMGLACLALEDSPIFPTYPNRMTSAEVSAGLVLPNAAVALMGKGGAACALLLVFMAVTSAFSSELISTSSIATYDIYKSYINPKASGKTLILISHSALIFFAFSMAGFSVGLYYVGISMGYLYLLMGVIISAAVIPASLTLLWKGQNFYAATISPVLGFISALVTWLVTAKCLFGELTVDSTGADMPMLAGNVVALLSPALYIPILTLIFKPSNFDFEELKKIKRVIDKPSHEEEPEEVVKEFEEETYEYVDPEETAMLERYGKWARIICSVMAVCFLVIWPMPMYGSHYIFSKKFFTGWVVVGIIWIFCSGFIVVFLPLWDGKHQIINTIRGIYWDVTFQSHKLKEWQNEHPEELSHEGPETLEIIGKPQVSSGDLMTEDLSDLEKKQ
ncbi:uncharacterized protein SAPINGB_P001304 [Magnusiomyces paraingens]|uniref:Urea active transporter n=1 Tax=Magnusiomyces paraingens TaxID=2606893 RepID=A0A5E8B509_9ASCO|nr:uncharacterized protein SAPINGB_P001304 [Saprochaete ingens]VVT46620.1 unnamed protein product [Saprochaete ingens]